MGRLISSSAPTGTVKPYAGVVAPAGYLLCDGSLQLKASYPELSVVCGNNYGTGTLTHFYLPDARGRTAVGKDNMGGTPANKITMAGSGISGVTLGAKGGEETHTLIKAELAAHTHPDPGGHPQTGGESARHYHDIGLFTVNTNIDANPSHVGVGTSGPYVFPSGSQQFTSSNNNTGDHTHTIPAVASDGSDIAHNNTQPSIILNYIIKT